MDGICTYGTASTHYDVVGLIQLGQAGLPEEQPDFSLQPPDEQFFRMLHHVLLEVCYIMW